MLFILNFFKINISILLLQFILHALMSNDTRGKLLLPYGIAMLFKKVSKVEKNILNRTILQRFFRAMKLIS